MSAQEQPDSASLKQQLVRKDAQIDQFKQQLQSLQAANRKQAHLTLLAFALLIDMRLGLEAGGSMQIARIARATAKKLQLESKFTMNDNIVDEVYYAGLLHNLGLIGLPDHILQTPYVEMNKEQRQIYDAAPLTTESIILTVPGLGNTAQVIHQLYERYDGKGFPEGAFGDQINIGSRILSPATDFGSLQNGTYFGERLSASAAIDKLSQDIGKRYDPVVMEAMLQLLKSLVKREKTEKERVLTSEDIKQGMTLAKDLYSPDRLLLMRQGQQLTDKIIASVKNLEQHSGKRMVFHIRQQA